MVNNLPSPSIIGPVIYRASFPATTWNAAFHSAWRRHIWDPKPTEYPQRPPRIHMIFRCSYSVIGIRPICDFIRCGHFAVIAFYNSPQWLFSEEDDIFPFTILHSDKSVQIYPICVLTHVNFRSLKLLVCTRAQCTIQVFWPNLLSKKWKLPAYNPQINTFNSFPLKAKIYKISPLKSYPNTFYLLIIKVPDLVKSWIMY